MSIIRSAVQAVARDSPRSAQRMAAFTAGYLGDPKPVETGADEQLDSDYAKGVAKHQVELEKEAASHGH